MKLWTFIKQNKKSVISSILIGGFFGTVISFLVAAVLLEISSNQFFAVYFGILFLIVGLAVGRRVMVSSAWLEGGRYSRMCLGLFSLIVLFAGISCFIVDHNALKLSPAQRIPFFLSLGIAVSFAVTFALVDVANSIVTSVHTSKQVFLILGASVLTGFVFGLIFGILDVEDDPSSRNGLFQDERFSAPIGFVVGSITSFINLYQDDGNGVVLEEYAPVTTFDDGL